MKVSRSYTLPYPCARVAALLCDPGFNVEREKLREGVVSCEFHGTEDGDKDARFELHTIEHKRTMTGSLDRNSTVNTLTTFRYDAGEGTVSWQYSGEAGKMMELWGIYTLTPQEDATNLAHEATIRVWVPFLGVFIERYIANEFEKADARYLDLMHRHLKGVD